MRKYSTPSPNIELSRPIYEKYSDSGATMTIGGTMRSIKSWNIRVSDNSR